MGVIISHTSAEPFHSILWVSYKGTKTVPRWPYSVAKAMQGHVAGERCAQLAQLEFLCQRQHGPADRPYRGLSVTAHEGRGACAMGQQSPAPMLPPPPKSPARVIFFFFFRLVRSVD